MDYIMFVVLLTPNLIGVLMTATVVQKSNYSMCVDEVLEFNRECEKFLKDNQNNGDVEVCENRSRDMMLHCQNVRIYEDCRNCFRKLGELVKKCGDFYESENATECIDLRRKLGERCSTKCPVCEDKLCENGGKCQDAEYIFSCRCPSHVKGVHCEMSRCSKTCQNNGFCSGYNTCNCPFPYTGSFCDRVRLGTRNNPAASAQEILQAGDSVGSGLYWIQPHGEANAALTFCDMAFDGGGWVLASYGYVEVDGDDFRNKVMLNLNYPNGYLWLPQQRSSSHGVISLSNGAVHLARAASYMIMAAGDNPNTGGIDQYRYVYKIDLSSITRNITFNNHNSYYGASNMRNMPHMHLQEFTIEGLKGDLKNYTRFSLAESLGVTARDSFPTGYGFFEKKERSAYFDHGPFFPSVHSGSGRTDSFRYGKRRSFPPDVKQACYRYNYKGWYTATSGNNYGQMSIWFKQ